MKRLIVAGVLFGIVITTYLISYFYIETTCEKTNKLLEDCVKAYETDKDAEKKAKELNDFWTEKERTLSIVANHQAIDDIELALSSLLSYTRSPDSEIFHEYAGTAKTLLHQLMEDTVPSVHSIL